MHPDRYVLQARRNVLDDFTIAHCRIGNTCTPYAYLVPRAWTVLPGNQLVVNAGGLLTIGHVMQVDVDPLLDTSATWAYKWAVQKVEFEAHKVRTIELRDAAITISEAGESAKVQAAEAMFQPPIPVVVRRKVKAKVKRRTRKG